MPKEVYGQFVDLMPIVCVDIVAQDEKNKKVILIKRDQHPLKGVYFFPGGRLIRGETFFSSAQRKLKEETGMDCEPVKVLTTVNTFFDTCEWKTRAGTQTINIVVLVSLSEKSVSQLKLNELHSDFIWVDPLPNQLNLNPYITNAFSLI